MLNVGYAKVDITPDYPVGLAGHFDDNIRISNAVESQIYTTCIAVTSGKETVLIYTLDSLGTEPQMLNTCREKVTAVTGIPGEKIFIGATHGHNLPSYSESKQYRADLPGWFVEAAKQALADRAPASVQAAVHAVDGMNFVRHYQNQDGSFFGSNFGAADNPIAHAGEKDSRLMLVKFERKAHHKDVLMINWQAHVDSSSKVGFYSISPSWAGVLRDCVSSETGMHVAYFTGASGNTNKDSRIKEENNGLTWKEYGQKMAQIVIGALDLLEPVEGTAIKTTRVMYDATINHAWDDKLEQANRIYDLWKSTDRPTATPLAKEYGFSSVFHAHYVRIRGEMEETGKVELNVFSIGNLGFTTGTYEMFGDSSLYIRERSPFAYTFVITGNHTYMPMERYFDMRTYEADTSLYARGTAELLDQKYVEMLSSLK